MDVHLFRNKKSAAFVAILVANGSTERIESDKLNEFVSSITQISPCTLVYNSDYGDENLIPFEQLTLWELLFFRNAIMQAT